MDYFYAAMDSFAWGVLGDMEKLAQTLRLPGIPLCDHCGSSPEFEAEREKWLEASTRDSILADFTRYIFQGMPGRKGPVITPVEAANMESIFDAHADRNNYWDQNSLESYLLAHIPNDEKCQALLSSCVSSLWKLVTYFSQWPFITPTPSAAVSSESTTRLPFSALSRAIAFLCGRHSKMFAHYNDARDADIPRREDRLALEYIFRALATDASQETTTTPPAPNSSSRSLHDDVLDTLNTVQPCMNEFTSLLNREKLFPLATRLLSSPAAPAPAASLSSLSVPASGPSGMLELLDLFVLLLRHATTFERTSLPGFLVKDLATARTELQNADGILFDEFVKLLGDDELINVYDAVALLFNTFPYPKSLTDGIGEDGDDLLLYSLRRPGSKLVKY